MERRARGAVHTVSEDGVTVQQYYTDTEFGLPSVVFEVATERAESAEIRFVVTDIEADRVGFHPRFRSDAWAITDDRLVFEATVGPDETVTTLYALDIDDQEPFERAMESLCIEQVVTHSQDGPSPDPGVGDTVANGRSEMDTASAGGQSPDGSVTGDSSGDAGTETTPDGRFTAVDESEGTDDESTNPHGGAARTDSGTPGVDEQPQATGDTEPEGSRTSGSETAAGDGGKLLQSREDRDREGERANREGQARDTNIGVTAGGGSSGQSGGPSSGGTESVADDADTGEAEQVTGQSADALVGELLGRLDRGELPPAARERLIERVTEEQSGADEARLASLQVRVSDIEAFSGPVEQLLDEHGPPAAALDNLDERLTALEGLDDRVSELETHVETVEEHENRIERLGEQVATLGDELDTATAQLEADVAEIETQFEGLQTELRRVEDTAETARERASDAGAHAGELDERLAELEEQLGGFGRRLDSVAGDWESVEADVAALQEWRRSLANTFGAVGE